MGMMIDEQNDIFGNPMKVREAIALLAYGTDYEIKGAYSGKIYHRSWTNKREHIEQFYDETVGDNPFYSNIRVNSTVGIGTWASPVIGIWMHDYYMCKEVENENDD